MTEFRTAASSPANPSTCPTGSCTAVTGETTSQPTDVLERRRAAFAEICAIAAKENSEYDLSKSALVT
ncbi:MAG: hypothetical protein KF688_13475 [Pirellulales bacterium]|nr:hypothetical protein [Pirellulales bacterium]